MKKIFLTLISFAGFFTAYSQTPINDSTIMGASYLNDVYYSLSNGTVKAEPNNNWDLAFRTGFATDGIRINSTGASGSAARTVKLYAYPNSDTSGWNNFDTSNYTTWTQLQNTDTSWDFGAFNISSTGFPDFSWGVYNMQSHVVTGDSLYLLSISFQGMTYLKKLWIKDKTFGNYTFTYANVDGSNENTYTIKNSDFTGVNLMYFNILTGTEVKREPATSSWDMVWTRYDALLAEENVYYPSTGILTNYGVEVAKAAKIDVNTVNEQDYSSAYTNSIGAIGADWKYFDMTSFRFMVEDSTVYFVKDKAGDIWKIQFTSFNGATMGANGKTEFTKTKLTSSGLSNQNINKNDLLVYPNPATQNLFIVNTFKGVNNQVQIFDLNGKLIVNQSVNTNGFSALEFNISDLKSGLYIVRVISDNQVSDSKFIKQ